VNKFYHLGNVITFDHIKGLLRYHQPISNLINYISFTGLSPDAF
jgi:hypothetical protein